MRGNNQTKYVKGNEMEKIQRTIEIERVVNLVKGFGWELHDVKVEGEMIIITIRKTVTPLTPAV